LENIETIEAVIKKGFTIDIGEVGLMEYKPIPNPNVLQIVGTKSLFLFCDNNLQSYKFWTYILDVNKTDIAIIDYLAVNTYKQYSLFPHWYSNYFMVKEHQNMHRVINPRYRSSL
jgi:hypothetical protein